MGKEYHGELQLASKAIFYDDEKLKDSEGTIHVTPWSTQDERLLVSPSVDFSETVSRLIKRCTDLTLDPNELLLVDRWHIFIYMRCLSYGGDYSFNYRCSDCKEKIRATIDLEKDLRVTYADDEELLASLDLESLKEPFQLELPITKKIVSWRMLRGKDQIAIDKYVKRSTHSRHTSNEDQGYIYRLARRIVEIEGKQSNISESIALVESLRGKDILAFRQAISSVDFGIETVIHPVCAKCGWENDEELPLDKTFFLPERQVA